jgi:hypothetical protein
LKDPRDPLVNEEIIGTRAMFVEGGAGGRGNFTMSEESLNILMPTLM